MQDRNQFVLLDDDAPNICQVLYDRARKKQDEYARELLEWSRTLEQHGLGFDAWLMSRGNAAT